MSRIRIVLLSDTHELHHEVIIPPGDLLLFAGDFSFFSKSTSAMDDFNKWMGELPHAKVAVCGNHEFAVEAEPDEWRRRLNHVPLLFDESRTVLGLNVWGSPMTLHDGGAFGRSSETYREKVYDTIPDDTDILITHGPPQGILDGGQGCAALRRAVILVQPRLHVFGHVHSGYGVHPTKNTLFVNCALLDEDGACSKKPFVLELDV
jgi:predicted phosphohydrolase